MTAAALNTSEVEDSTAAADLMEYRVAVVCLSRYPSRTLVTL